MNLWSRMEKRLATRFPQKPVVYFLLWCLWLITLYFLSAGHPMPKNAPSIPHLDKLAHFSYFFGGGVLLASFCLFFRPCWRKTRWKVFIVVVLIGTIVGRLDEYHQTFTPGRSGNDNADWLADVLGTSAAAIFVLCWLLPKVINGRVSKNISSKS